MEYKLSIQKGYGVEHHWAILYEFSDIQGFDWSGSNKEILNAIIGTRLFDNSKVHPGFDKEKVKVHIENIDRPFVTDNLKSSDFTYIGSSEKLEETLKDFESKDDRGDDLPDFKNLKKEVFLDISEEFNFRNGVWYLNKKSLEGSEGKLLDNHRIYSYYLVMIEIDPESKTIRLVEIGYD